MPLRSMRVGVWLVILLWLAACAPIEPIPTPTIAPVSTLAAVDAPTLPAFASAATAVVVPTAPISSATLAPTPASTPVVSPTATAGPIAAPITPTTATGDTVRFAVIGDFGLAISPGEAAVAARVHGWQPDFILTVGDNNYPAGSADTLDANVGRFYHDFIAPYTGRFAPAAETGGANAAAQNRFFPTLGNHDWETPDAQPYLDYFTLPGNERYYDFTWGFVRLYAVDSDMREPDGTTPDSAQGQWLQAALAAPAAQAACWNVVYFHHPPYTSGPHGPNVWMRWPFQAWGADAVLSGHDHIYERLLIDGFPYFINGLGGSVRYALGNPAAGSQARFQAEFGALLVTATRRTLIFQFITVDGRVIDSYTLAGGCDQ